MRRLFITLAAIAAPSLASAQTTPPPPDGSAGVQGSVTLQTPANNGAMAPMQVQPTAQCSSGADSLYNEGMNRMAAGDDAGAATLFGRVLELCPSHPTAAEMRRNAEQHAQARASTGTGTTVTTSGPSVTGNAVQPPAGTITVEGQGGMSFLAPAPNYNLVYGPDPVTLGARLNLVIGQTLFGMALGGWVPGMIAGTNVRAEHVGGGILLGGALGAAGSLVASLGGVTQGQAIAVNFGSGGGLGLGLGAAMLGGFSDPQLTFGLIAAGQAIGTAAGAIVALQRPLSGKMSYISSLAGWATLLTSHVYMGTGALNSATGLGGVQVMGGMIVGGIGAGTLAGALTASFVHVSADRMGWIDLSMSAGWLVVGSASALFALSGGSGLIAYAWGSIAGVGLGAVFGILMTRDTDRYWHQAREQQLREPATQRTARRTSTPASFHFSPGGPGNSPIGMTFAGTF